MPIFSDVLKGYLGPLAGIHASLSWVKKNKPNYSWIFTFAGDSPFFPSNIVKTIHEKAIKKDKKISEIDKRIRDQNLNAQSKIND